MSQHKRKSEYIKPVQSNPNKSQSEKRSSLRNTSRELSGSFNQNNPKDKTKPHSEGQSFNNQSRLSSKSKQNEPVVGHSTDQHVSQSLEQSDHQASARQSIKRDSNTVMLTPIRNEQIRADEEQMSSEKQIDPEAITHRKSIASNVNDESEDRLKFYEESKAINRDYALEAEQDLQKDESDYEHQGSYYSREDFLPAPRESNFEHDDKIEEQSREDTEGAENLTVQAREEDIKEAILELKNAANRLTIKTFITLRNINKPIECTVKAFHALLCLFADVSSFIPNTILHQEMEWNVLKNYLQSPIYLVGQIHTFIQNCQEGRISPENISKANGLICSIDPTQIQAIESYNALLAFVCAALEYWRKAYSNSDLQEYQSNTGSIGANSNKKEPLNQKEHQAEISKREQPLISPVKVYEDTERSKKSINYETPRKDYLNIKPLESNRNQASSVLERFDHISSRSPIKYDEKLILKDTANPLATSRKKLEKPNLAKSILKLPQSNLTEKLNRAKEDKTNRTSYCSTARPLSRPEDQQLLAEMTERAQIQEDTQTYKKIAREFRQKTAKLLLEQSRQLKAEAKGRIDAEMQFDRDSEILANKKLEECLINKKIEEKDYDLAMYQDRQDSRMQKKILRKDIEEDYLYHELEQNLLQHYNKAECELDKKIDRQKVLQARLEKMQIDRGFKKRQLQFELQQQAKENIEMRDRDLHWKKLEALNERIEAEKEYRLLEKLFSK